MREVITPPNRLAESVVKGRGPSLETILERVNTGIEQLQHDYESELQSELKRLSEAARRLAGASGAEQEAALRELYEVAHEIRGQAGSFGYPLLTNFANSLCGFIERPLDRSPTAIDVIEHHVGAMRAVAAGGVKGDGGRQGQELLVSLGSLIDKASAEAKATT